MSISSISFCNPMYMQGQNKKLSFKGNSSDAKYVTISGKETTAKIYTRGELDYKTMNQIKDLCNHPAFTDAPIRIMPDVHPSSNTIVGFSAPMINGKIIPGIIGGDIGCGMLCVKIDTQGKDIDYEKLDEVVKTYVSVRKLKTPQAIKKAPKTLTKDLQQLCKKLQGTSAD